MKADNQHKPEAKALPEPDQRNSAEAKALPQPERVAEGETEAEKTNLVSNYLQYSSIKNYFVF